MTESAPTRAPVPARAPPAPSRRDRRRRVRRPVCRARASPGRRRRGDARRPAQPPPVPAAALPGRHRRPVAGRDRAAAALDLPQAANTTVLLGEATGIDPGRARRSFRRGPPPYDTLIVATGARHATSATTSWAPFAPGLKTIDDATEMRRRILIAFEAAEREADPTGPPRVDDLRGGGRRAHRASSWRAPLARSRTTRCERTSGRSTRRTPGSS